MIKKVLFIGRKLESTPKFGGGLINKRNLHFLQEFYGEENVDFFHPEAVSRLARMLSAHAPWPLGIHQKLNNQLVAGNYDLIFLSTNEFGSLLKFIKNLKLQKMPKIVTFAHNCEKNFAKDYFKTEKSFSRFIFMLEHSREEKLAIKYADHMLGMLERDNLAMQHYYNKSFAAIIPSSLKDFYPENTALEALNNPVVLLFIGSDLPFNKHGLTWFVDNVLSYIEAEVIAIGKGSEQWQTEISHPKLQILGTVDELAPYYNRADAVISPIFLGSGMKTKTTEVLMFGKAYFATKESFEGFDKIDFNQEQGLFFCQTATDFIAKLTNFIQITKTKPFYANLRQAYLNYYSDNATKQVFFTFLKSLDC